MEIKRSEIVKTILKKKNKVLTVSDIETYYKDIVIKKMWH